MVITRTSPFSGEENRIDVDVTQEELYEYYHGGKLLQDAFPNLSADHREFIKTGIMPEEWDQMNNREDER